MLIKPGHYPPIHYREMARIIDAFEQDGFAVLLTPSGLEIEAYNIQLAELICQVFEDADGYPWHICWDEEDTLAVS